MRTFRQALTGYNVRPDWICPDFSIGRVAESVREWHRRRPLDDRLPLSGRVAVGRRPLSSRMDLGGCAHETGALNDAHCGFGDPRLRPVTEVPTGYERCES